MNNSNVLFLTIVILVCFVTLGQAQSIDGVYTRELKTNDGGKIAYKLSLEKDSTFTFTYYRKLATDPAEQTKYSKGSWKLLDNKRIELIAHGQQVESPNFINLKQTRAHFITKSPRDKSDRDIPTSLKIYDSNIAWIKGISIEKQ